MQSFDNVLPAVCVVPAMPAARNPLQWLREVLADQIAQLRADWNGEPELAEHIFRIVNPN